MGEDVPAKGEWWAVAAALVFVVVPPNSAGGSGAVWFVRDDAYVVATLVFISQVETMLWIRRRGRPAPQTEKANIRQPVHLRQRDRPGT